MRPRPRRTTPAPALDPSPATVRRDSGLRGPPPGFLAVMARTARVLGWSRAPRRSRRRVPVPSTAASGAPDGDPAGARQRDALGGSPTPEPETPGPGTHGPGTPAGEDGAQAAHDGLARLRVLLGEPA
nr:hypothetical protein StreXyl84_51530 [Streptomyces sp. Xyl84]